MRWRKVAAIGCGGPVALFFISGMVAGIMGVGGDQAPQEMEVSPTLSPSVEPEPTPSAKPPPLQPPISPDDAKRNRISASIKVCHEALGEIRKALVSGGRFAEVDAIHASRNAVLRCHNEAAKMDARENLPEDLAACRDANLVGEDKARLLETLVDSRTPSNAANLEMAAALYEEALDRCIKSSGAKNPR